MYNNAKMIPAMKIWKAEGNNALKLSSILAAGGYFGQLKKDGYFYQFEKTPSGNGYLFSRNISRTTGMLTEKSANVPHIMETLNKLPCDTIILGEIYFPGKTSKDVTKIMGCLPEEAIKRQEKDGKIYYYIHDLIYYNYEDYQQKGAYERYLKLKEIFEEYNLGENPYIQLADIEEDNLLDFANNALSAGEEGVVLKKRDCPYYPDKRPAWSMIKIKKSDTVDAFIIGYEQAERVYTGKELETWPYWEEKAEDGEWYKAIGDYFEAHQHNPHLYRPITKGYYNNWVTRIRVGAYLDNGEIKDIGLVHSGLTDEMCDKFAREPEKYLHKVIEISCMEKDNNEKTLRHASFKRFREDKNDSDCKISEIFQ